VLSGQGRVRQQVGQLQAGFGLWIIAYPAGLIGPFLIEYLAREHVNGEWPPAVEVFGKGQALPPIVVVGAIAAMSMRRSPRPPFGKTAVWTLILSTVAAAFYFGATISSSISLTGDALTALEDRTVWKSVTLGVLVLLASAYGNWIAEATKVAARHVG
jgi:hypothetical protein